MIRQDPMGCNDHISSRDSVACRGSCTSRCDAESSGNWRIFICLMRTMKISGESAISTKPGQGKASVPTIQIGQNFANFGWASTSIVQIWERFRPTSKTSLERNRRMSCDLGRSRRVCAAPDPINGGVRSNLGCDGPSAAWLDLSGQPGSTTFAAALDQISARRCVTGFCQA